MKKNYNLKSLTSNQTLKFTWDNKTGDIGGRDSEFWRNLIASTNEVSILPPTYTSFPVPDVVTDKIVMSLLISGDWDLPDDWPALNGERDPEGVLY